MSSYVQGPQHVDDFSLGVLRNGSVRIRWGQHMPRGCVLGIGDLIVGITGGTCQTDPYN